MTFEQFADSLNQTAPPLLTNPLLLSLWHDGKGNWEAAHNIAQDVESTDGAWIHAYLHRKEGDIGNASYWYHRAGKKIFNGSLDDEWRDLVGHFLTEA